MVLKEIQNEYKHKGEHFLNLLTRLWCQKFKIEECIKCNLTDILLIKTLV